MVSNAAAARNAKSVRVTGEVRGIRCPVRGHGPRYIFERRGIGVTQFLCDRCSWKTAEILTEIFK